MGESKRRLLPWLKDQINGSHFPGVEWLNKEEEIFKMPWKHASKHNWKESDSLIFKEWAIVSGRFHEGDTPKWSEWKMCLRNALNKMEEKGVLVRMTTKENQEGSDPYRVYKFICNQEKDCGEMENSLFVSAEQSEQSEGYNIPTFIEGLSCGDCLTSSPQQSTSNGYCGDDELMETDESSLEVKQLIDFPMPDPSPSILELLKDNSKEEIALVQPEENEFIIRIKYRNMEVARRQIHSEGCCLFYGSPVEVMQDDSRPLQFFDQRNLEPIPFPSYDLMPIPELVQKINTLLNGLKSGLLLWCYNNNIYAMRKCRTRISVLPANSSDFKLTKLVKDGAPVLIFDFVHFINCLIEYLKGNTTVLPSAEVLIGVGQDWKPGDNPSNNLIISVTAFPSVALFHFGKNCLGGKSLPDSSELQISDSSSFDNYLEDIESLLMSAQQNQAASVGLPGTYPCY